jgi:hypothetical protein
MRPPAWSATPCVTESLKHEQFAADGFFLEVASETPQWQSLMVFQWIVFSSQSQMAKDVEASAIRVYLEEGSFRTGVRVLPPKSLNR